jgi:endonuclease/exonuclease/phosphatase family metal-dependent hydrolase
MTQALRTVALLLSLLPELALADNPPPTLRLLSYNIHHAEGLDKKTDLPRIANIITATNSDLVALQEIDLSTNRTNKTDQPKELARLTSMHAYFAKAMDYQGGAYGQLILSKTPITQSETHPLPFIDPKAEPRTVARITTKIANQTITLFATHLDHKDEPARLKQAAEINRLAAKIPPDHLLFLAGDLNARPDSPPMQTIFEKWQNLTAGDHLLTIPAEKPKAQIDYILARPGAPLKILDSKVLDEPVASDHRPILTTLELPPK